MYFSRRKWRDQDTTEQQTSKDPTSIGILRPACPRDLLFINSLAIALMDGIAKERKTWSQ